MVLLGLLLIPFAYVLDQGEDGYGTYKFDWKLPSIASAISSASDQNYEVGPALSYISGGYIATILLSLALTIGAVLALRPPAPSSEDFVERQSAHLNLAAVLGNTTAVVMGLLFLWQVAGMWTLQRAADADGGLTGGDTLNYFSLGFGSVVSLLGIATLIFAGLGVAGRSRTERRIQRQ